MKKNKLFAILAISLLTITATQACWAWVQKGCDPSWVAGWCISQKPDLNGVAVCQTETDTWNAFTTSLNVPKRQDRVWVTTTCVYDKCYIAGAPCTPSIVETRQYSHWKIVSTSPLCNSGGT